MEDARAALARGVADRLRSVLLAMDRRDRLESAAPELDGWLGREAAAGRLAGHAREILLRALKSGADPVNFDLLRRLDGESAADLAGLMRATGLGRVALSERLNDLVQAGLASRELIGDQIRGTELAAGLLTLVEEAAAAAGERLAAELGKGGAASSSGGAVDG